MAHLEIVDLPIEDGDFPYFFHGTSPCLLGKSTISMAIFHRFLYVYHIYSGFTHGKW